MTVRKLKRMPYAQAEIITTDDNTVILKSYNTFVVYLKPDRTITVTGLYSATTRKHISAFMQEYGLTYADAKKAYENRA